MSRKLRGRPSRFGEMTLIRRNAEQLRAEIRQDLAAMNSYVEQHGSFFEMVAQYYGNRDET